MKAKDLMSPIEEYLTPDMSLCTAVTRMRGIKRIHGLPIKGMLVKNEQGTVVGMVSIKDILRAVIPPYMSPDLSIFSWDNMLEQMSKRASDKVVGDVMVKDLVTIDSAVPLMLCTDLMIKKGLQRLPVTDENDEIIGMVYIRDIFNIVAKYIVKGGQEHGTC